MWQILSVGIGFHESGMELRLLFPGPNLISGLVVTVAVVGLPRTCRAPRIGVQLDLWDTGGVSIGSGWVVKRKGGLVLMQAEWLFEEE